MQYFSFCTSTAYNFHAIICVFIKANLVILGLLLYEFDLVTVILDGVH